MTSFSHEDLERSFAQFSGGGGPKSAEEVFNNTARIQEQEGTAGHQADFYQPSLKRQRELFTDAGQTSVTNPEQQAGHETEPSADAARHIGNVAAGQVIGNVSGVLEVGQPTPGQPVEQSPATPAPEQPLPAPTGNPITDRLAGL